MQTLGVICFTFLVLVVYEISASFKITGPYKVDVKKISPCVKNGHQLSNFSVKMAKKDRRQLTWNIRWILKEDFTDDLVASIEMKRWTSAGWGTVYKHVSNKPCQDALHKGGTTFSSFLTLAGLPVQCPVKSGNYVTEGLVVNDTITGFNKMPYGKYDLECTYTKGKVTAGCWAIKADIIEDTDKT